MMKSYMVAYYDKSGDYHKVWVTATNKEDAELEAKREYWNIERISFVEELYGH